MPVSWAAPATPNAPSFVMARSPQANSLAAEEIGPGAAETYALLGWPLNHSLSPALHNAAFQEAGIPARYVLRPTPPPELPAAVKALRRGELAGANVTIPHKMAIRSLLDSESELVRVTGAVNTILRTADRLHAENTDVAGFRHALAEVGLASGGGGRALVLGAGGAARAVVYVLAEEGFAVQVLARRVSASAVLVARLHRTHPRALLSSGILLPEALPAAAERADLLVNATPVGADPDAGASLWPEEVPVPAHLTVIDLVAWPTETRFVAQARASGARATGGLVMLIGQAAAAFELWTGRRAPLEVMDHAARQVLQAATAPRAEAPPPPTGGRPDNPSHP